MAIKVEGGWLINFRSFCYLKAVTKWLVMLLVQLLSIKYIFVDF